MKKISILCLGLLLASCVVEVGDFSDKRLKLHEMGYPEDYCEQKPERCVEGVPW